MKYKSPMAQFVSRVVKRKPEKDVFKVNNQVVVDNYWFVPRESIGDDFWETFKRFHKVITNQSGNLLVVSAEDDGFEILFRRYYD